MAERSVHAATAVNVTVNAATTLGQIPSTAFGANTAVWDGDLTDGALPGLLQAAGIKILRFPGGSTADNYHWQTNTQTNGGYTNPNNTFDNFMKVVRQAGAQPVITVNYGSNSAGTGGGDPNEAAAWVQYANVTKGYGVKYWEIGNEVYGNGTYGSAWETDLHAQKGPAAYATNALAFISAMKAVDPSIKIGLVLTAPGNWPDGQTPDWNSTVLSTACSQMDFAVIHWYAQNPGTESDAGLLASTATIPTMISTLRSEFAQYCGARAGQIQIFVTETNSVSYNPGKQTVGLVNALFLADNYMNWLEQGVSNVDWWDLHNGIVTGTNNSPSLYGAANYGDYGLLSYGTSSGSVSEPANETPFPAYYGLQMLTHLGAGGDQMVGASSSQNLVAVHAVRQANGNLALLIINKDPSTSYPVSITLNGYTPASSATAYTYGENSSAISSSSITDTGTGFSQTVAPYSLTTVVFQPAAPGAPLSATSTPTVAATPTSTATAPLPTSTAPAPTDTSTPVPPVASSTPTAPAATSTPTMSFVSTVTLSPASLAPGGTDLVQATVQNTGSLLTNGVVDLEIYNSSGMKVGQQFFQGQTLMPHQVSTYDWEWPVPPQAGSYTVKVGIFASGWSQLYAWNNGAATLTVTSGASASTATGTAVPPTATATATQQPPTATTTPVPPTMTATSTPVVSTATSTPSQPSTLAPSPQSTASAPGTVTQGTSATLHVSVTNSGGALLNSLVDLEIYASTGQRVAQQFYTGQNLLSGQSASYSWQWTAPSQTGIYTLKVGVFGPNWSPLYNWNNQAAQITVGAASSALAAAQPSFTVSSPISSLTVTRGAFTSFRVNVVGTSSLSGGIVDLEVHDSANAKIAQHSYQGQLLAAGKPQSYVWGWRAPLQPGTYQLEAGIFGANWIPEYAWTDRVLTIYVRATAK